MRIYLENARNTEEIFPDVHCPLSFCLPLHLPWIYLMWVILYALESKCPGTCRGPQDWIQVTWLGSKHPYMLSHLTSPLSVSFSNNHLAQISFGHHCVRGSSWFISEGTHSASDSSRNGDTRGTGLTLLSVTVAWFGAFLVRFIIFLCTNWGEQFLPAFVDCFVINFHTLQGSKQQHCFISALEAKSWQLEQRLTPSYSLVPVAFSSLPASSLWSCALNAP